MLNNEDSHFNGKDPDYEKHTILDWSRDLGHNARGLRYWYIFCESLKKEDIHLINLSNTGLLISFQKKILINYLSEQKIKILRIISSLDPKFATKEIIETSKQLIHNGLETEILTLDKKFNYSKIKIHNISSYFLININLV